MTTTDNIVTAANAVGLALKVAQLAHLAIGEGGAALSEFNDLHARLAQFEAEEREPSAADFLRLQSRTTELTARLDAAANRLG